MFDSDIKINGKHATYAKFLCQTSGRAVDGGKAANVFDTIMDIYMVAPIIGLVYSCRDCEDKESKDYTTIFAEKVIKEQLNLQYVFRLVMLMDEYQGLSVEDKILRAFGNDDEKSRLELFNAYMRGGIRYLYEYFDKGTTREHYIERIYELVDGFVNEHNIQM